MSVCVYVCMYFFIFVTFTRLLPRVIRSCLVTRGVGQSESACVRLSYCVMAYDGPIRLDSVARKWQPSGVSVSRNVCLAGSGYAISER